MQTKDEDLHQFEEGEALFSAVNLFKVLKQHDDEQEAKTNIHRMARIFVDDSEQKKFEAHYKKLMEKNMT